MRYLKQNTATRITVGPFLDKTDGITPEVALTVTACRLTLMVDNGGVPTLVLDALATASGGSNDMVHVTNDDAGFYDLELTAAQLNYVGRAMLSINDVATHCPVFHEFTILPANVYDSLIGGSDLLDVSAAQFAGQTVTCGAGVTVRADVGTATQSTAQTGDAYARLGAPAGASVSADIAAAKGDTAAILADTGTDGVVVAAGSKTGYSLSAAGIQAIWDALTSALTTVGSIGKLLVDNINATIASRSSHAAADIWSVATRLLTAGTNIVLAKGVGVTGFTDLDAAGVRGAVGLGAANLDTQLDALPTAAENADAVWDEARAGHVGAGSFGEGVASVQGNVTGSAASVTGAVGSVTADVGITQAGADKVWSSAARTLTSFGTLVTDIWGAVTRTLSAGTNIVLAKGVGVTGFTDLDAAGVRGAVGLAAANLDTQLDALPTAAENADAICDEVLSGHTTAGTVGQRLQPIRTGTAQAGDATSITLDAGASAVTDFYVDDVIHITGGTGAGQSRAITAYNGTSKVATVSTWGTNPAADSVFQILPGGSGSVEVDAPSVRSAIGLASANLDTQLDALPTAAENADAIWDEAIAGHLGAGSTGEKLNGASAPSAGAVADAVWDETLAGHLGAGSTGEALNAAGAAGDPWTTQLPGGYGAGSAGKIIGDNINATISSRSTLTAQQVWEYATRTLSSFGALVGDIWANATRTLTAISDSAGVTTLLTRIVGTLLAGNHTAQTGDTYVLANGASGFAAIDAKTTNLPADPADESLVIAATDAIMTRLGAPAGVSMSADVAAVKADTAATLSESQSHPTLAEIEATTVLAKQTKLDTLHDTRIPGVIQPQTGDAYARVGAPAGASLSADVAAVKTDTAAVLVDTGTDGVVVAAASKSGYALSAAGIDAVLDDTIGDGTLTLRQALRVLIAASAGKLSGAATTTITIRNAADTANVLVATVDADGNRSAVVVTP